MNQGTINFILQQMHTLQEKARAMEAKTRLSCNHYIVFSTSGFSRGLKEEAAGNSNILLVDTFSPKKDERMLHNLQR